MRMKTNKQRQNTHHEAYMKIAYVFGGLSHCERKKVGCIIVKDGQIISNGYNGTPSGFDNKCEDCNGVTKDIVLHAESNAITKLAKTNNSSVGATLYTTLSPCIDCAKLIVQAGIEEVIFHDEYKCTDGINLLVKAGIKVTIFKIVTHETYTYN